MTYLSGAISQVQLFVEFFFEVLNEKSEPLVLGLQILKAGFSLKEYHQLVSREKITVNINMELY